MNKKIILKQRKDSKILIKTNKMCPVDAIHILATALTRVVKEYEATEDKKDFQRIMGKYYDDAN